MGDKAKITKPGIIIIIGFLVIGLVVTGLYIWGTKDDDKAGQEAFNSSVKNAKESAKKAKDVMPIALELIKCRGDLKNMAPGTQEYLDKQSEIEHDSLEIASKLPSLVLSYGEDGIPVIPDDNELINQLEAYISGK